MQITTQWMRQHFILFNARYFGGKLPEPRLALSNARTRLGSVSYKISRRPTGTHPKDVVLQKYNFCIRLSTFYEQSERDYQNTLLHEMIHYYIDVNQLTDNAPHGTLFREWMNRLNRQGWNISVREKSHLKRAVGTKQDHRCVLALEMTNGECWFCVIHPHHVFHIDNQARRISTIATRRWFLATDDYFLQYAQSRTLRGHRVSRQFFEEKIGGMIPQDIAGVR